MSVPPIQLAALDWAAAAAGTMARPWPVGSVVSGRVLEWVDGIRLILQINGQTVEADPPSNGLVPQNFQARVLSNGQQPLLELLGPPAKGAATAAALRARLPHQGGLQPLLADLQALAGTPGVRALPEPVRAALARLEASITDRHDILDPDILRDAVRRAGTQLEHALLQQARTPDRLPATRIDYDLKATLQRVAQTLRSLPPVPRPAAPAPPGVETPPPLLNLPLQPQPRVPPTPAADALALATGMLGRVQAALSRIEIMQLEAHPSASPQACMFELPVRGDDGFDVLQIRIEQDASGSAGAAPPQWTLGFSLEPPGLGAIHGQIRLRGAKVDVDLWAQHDAAVHALEEQTSVLARLLESSGLLLVQLRVRQGTPSRHTGLAPRLLEASA